MKLVLALAALCFCQAVLGQGVSRLCQDEFKEAKECLKGLVDKEELEQRRAKMEAKKENFKQCLEENGCQVPEIDEEERERMKECKRRVFQDFVRPMIETCVGELEEEEEMEGGPPGHHGFRRGGRRGGRGKHNKLKKLCPSEAIDGVRSCLREQEGRRRRNFREMFAKFQAMMTKLAECKAKISSECQSELCGCVEQFSEDDEEKIREAMRACRPPREEDDDDSSSSGRRRHGGRGGGSPLNKIKHLVCEESRRFGGGRRGSGDRRRGSEGRSRGSGRGRGRGPK